MKKCTQCGQSVNDDAKFCFKCGGSQFEQIVEQGQTQPITGQQSPTYNQQPTDQQAGSYQQPVYQQPVHQQQYHQQSYQQPVYQQPYQQPFQQPNDNEPVSIGMYLLGMFLISIPVVNLIFAIVLSVSKSFKKSYVNFGRAALIWMAISLVLSIIIIVACSGMIYELINYVDNGVYYGF